MAINVGTAMAFLELDTSKFTTGLASAGADLRDFATNGNVQSLGNAMNGIGSDLTKGVTLPVAGAGAAIVKVAADYEQQLSKIKAVSGGTAEEMKQLDDLALKMGKDTSFSAKEAAQGIEELSKAGLTNEQILNGGLKGALSLASAGDLELADAASIASDALNTFKADALSVGDAANILAGAANASSTDVGELKYGMSAAGSVAAGMGMNFKDTATALAVFANNGLKGSDAGTSLKTMLMNLQPSTDAQYATFERLGLMTYDTTKAYNYLVKEGITPASNSFADVDKAMRKHAAEEAGAKEGTKKADKAYRELTNQLGVLHSKFYDNNGNMKSLAEVTEILKESTTGLTNAQRAQVLESMFGSDAIRGANILFKEGAKGINDMQAAMAKVTADEVAATKLDNFKGSLDQFMGSIETLAIVLGKLLLPYLKQMVDWLTGILNKFLELPEPVQKNIMAMLGIAAAVGPLLIVFSKVVGAVGTVINAFKALSSIGSILSALPALMNPYVAGIILIIAAIATAVYLIYKNWDALSSYFSNLWEWIKKIFGEFWEWMKAFFAEWGPTILAIMFPFLAIPIKIWEHWGQIKIWFTELYNHIASICDSIGQWFSDAIDKWIGIWDGFTDFMSGIGSSMWEGLISGLEKGWDWVYEKVGNMAEGIKTLFKKIFDINSPSRVFRGYGVNIGEGLVQGIDSHSDSVGNATTNTANKITKGFENAINSDTTSGLVSSYGGEVVSSIAGVMNDNFPVISSNINKISSYINGALDNLPIPAASILSNALGSIGSNLKEMSINWASNKIEMSSNSGVMTSVTDKFKLYTNAMNVSSAASKIATITTNALSIATSVFSTVMTVLTGPVGLVVLAITGLAAASYLLWSNWDSIGPKLKAIWEDISNFAINVFSGLGSVFEGFGTNIMDGLLSGLVSGIEGIKNCVESIGDSIKNTFKRLLGINSPSKIFHEYGGFIGEGLVNGLDAQDSTITSKFGTLGNKIKNIGNVKPNIDLTNATGNLGKLTELSNLEIRGNYKATPHENYAPKQFSFNPEIVMHVSVADTGAKGTAQLTNELKSMTKSSLKNGLVDSFLNDAFRL